MTQKRKAPNKTEADLLTRIATADSDADTARRAATAALTKRNKAIHILIQRGWTPSEIQTHCGIAAQRVRDVARRNGQTWGQ